MSWVRYPKPKALAEGESEKGQVSQGPGRQPAQPSPTPVLSHGAMASQEGNTCHPQLPTRKRPLPSTTAVPCSGRPRQRGLVLALQVPCLQDRGSRECGTAVLAEMSSKQNAEVNQSQADQEMETHQVASEHGAEAPPDNQHFPEGLAVLSWVHLHAPACTHGSGHSVSDLLASCWVQIKGAFCHPVFW